jgi:large subunit ribosomal protein L17
MRHQVHGKKLNRSSGHRKALYRNLVQSLVEHERITTTLAKAKAVRPVAEQLITRAKKQDLAARRAVISFLPTTAAADKVYEVLAPRFADRPGGYTRIIKVGRRVGDGVEMAVLELVELSAPSPTTSAAKKTAAKPAKTQKAATAKTAEAVKTETKDEKKATRRATPKAETKAEKKAEDEK